MIKDFKFFFGNEKRIDWGITGLLEGATNVPLLIRALDMVYKYIVDNNLINNQPLSSMLFPIITRLYRNKMLYYNDYSIRDKIDHVVAFMNSTAIRRMLQEISSTTWVGIDVEAETCAIVFENCNWEESYGI